MGLCISCGAAMLHVNTYIHSSRTHIQTKSQGFCDGLHETEVVISCFSSVSASKCLNFSIPKIKASEATFRPWWVAKSLHGFSVSTTCLELAELWRGPTRSVMVHMNTDQAGDHWIIQYCCRCQSLFFICPAKKIQNSLNEFDLNTKQLFKSFS